APQNHEQQIFWFPVKDPAKFQVFARVVGWLVDHHFGPGVRGGDSGCSRATFRDDAGSDFIIFQIVPSLPVGLAMAPPQRRFRKPEGGEWKCGVVYRADADMEDPRVSEAIRAYHILGEGFAGAVQDADCYSRELLDVITRAAQRAVADSSVVAMLQSFESPLPRFATKQESDAGSERNLRRARVTSRVLPPGKGRGRRMSRSRSPRRLYEEPEAQAVRTEDPVAWDDVREGPALLWGSSEELPRRRDLQPVQYLPPLERPNAVRELTVRQLQAAEVMDIVAVFSSCEIDAESIRWREVKNASRIVGLLRYYYNIESGKIQWEHPGQDAVVTAVSLAPGSSGSGSCLSGDGLVAQLASELHSLCESDVVQTHGKREWLDRLGDLEDLCEVIETPSCPAAPLSVARGFGTVVRVDASGGNLPLTRRSDQISDIVNDPLKACELDQDRFEARLEDFRAGGLDEDYFYYQLVSERDGINTKEITPPKSAADPRSETRDVLESAFIAVERCDDPKKLTDILALCDIDCSNSLLAGYSLLMMAALLHRPGPVVSVLASWPFSCHADVVHPYTGDNVFHMLVREAIDIPSERRFTDFLNAYVGESPTSVPSHIASAVNQYNRVDGGATPVLLAVMPINGVYRTDTMVARLVGRLQGLGAQCAQCLLDTGDTPLHFAARHGYRKTVELLLSGGADCRKNKAGELPEDVTDNVTILELFHTMSPKAGETPP
ncbi:hypothetical protein FOL47_002843, partial [Perkinsus chesapeaki]